MDNLVRVLFWLCAIALCFVIHPLLGCMAVLGLMLIANNS